MKNCIRLVLLLGCMTIPAASCSTVPRDIREIALDVPFETLARNPDRFAGRIVILGGYIEQIRVAGNTTRFVVLQAPLGMFDQPKSKDRSEGRFLVIYDGLLEKEDYGIGQDITLVGTVLGDRVPEFKGYTAPMPAVEMIEIYRWRYGHEDDYCDTPINGYAFPPREYPYPDDRKIYERRLPERPPYPPEGEPDDADR